jgi:prepilin-type N-terminal cleavage/methylation domain-containing protein
MTNINRQKAFTLTEIIVVVIILGIIATLGVRYYINTMEHAHQRDAIVNLTAIHSANQVYRARNGQYWPPASNQGVNAINTALKLNIIEDGMTYTCNTGGTPGQTFACFADRKPPAALFRVRVTQAPLTATNPQCVTGACP